MDLTRDAVEYHGSHRPPRHQSLETAGADR